MQFGRFAFLIASKKGKSNFISSWFLRWVQDKKVRNLQQGTFFLALKMSSI